MKYLVIALIIALFATAGQDVQSDNQNDSYETFSYNESEEYEDACITQSDSFSLDGEDYIKVGILEGSTELSERVASFSDGTYYYEVFLLENYPGLAAVYSKYAYEMDSDTPPYFTPDLYASDNVAEIPAELIYEFPHRNILPSWIDGIETEKMNGSTYVRYRSTEPGFSVGELLFTHNGKEYFSVPDCPGWVATTNDYDPERYDLWYDSETVDTLPMRVLLGAGGIVY